MTVLADDRPGAFLSPWSTASGRRPCRSRVNAGGKSSATVSGAGSSLRVWMWQYCRSCHARPACDGAGARWAAVPPSRVGCRRRELSRKPEARGAGDRHATTATAASSTTLAASDSPDPRDRRYHQPGRPALLRLPLAAGPLCGRWRLVPAPRSPGRAGGRTGPEGHGPRRRRAAGRRRPRRLS